MAYPRRVALFARVIGRRLPLEDRSGEAWERPLPRRWLLGDLLTALGFLAFGAAGLEAYRSLGLVTPDLHGASAQYAALVAMSALVVVRRRFPATAVLVVSALLVLVERSVPSIMQTLAVQVLCLLLFFSVAAWGRRRSTAALTLIIAAGLIAVRVVWQVMSVSGTLPPEPVAGFVPPIVASLVYGLMLNLVLVAGASAAGWLSWRGARRRELLAQHADALVAQAVERRDQAVLDERVRIARDLHDVVAHHVAGISIQAAAARINATSGADDETSGQLRRIERSAREAVTELGAALKGLRADELDQHGSRRGLADIDVLVAECAEKGLAVTVTVEADPDVLAQVPSPVDLSAYRVVQEALANVRRHSTATRAQVAIRASADGGAHHVEVEVLDSGRPQAPAETGTGLGIIGVRERLVAHGGEGEMGPRAEGGYRVRVRFPFDPAQAVVPRPSRPLSGRVPATESA